MTAPTHTPSLGSAYALKCRECGATTDLDASYACMECFGPLEVAYAPATVTREQIEAGPASMWRYEALLPVAPGPYEQRHQEQKRSIVRMEFKSFLAALMRLPAQIVRSGRRIVYRLMSWNPWTGCLLRLAEALHRPLRC